MSAPTITFGSGDYGGYNDWAIAGSNFMYTSWSNTPFSPGSIGRINAIASRMDAYSGLSGSCAVHNGLYLNNGSSYPRSSVTADYTMGAVGAGTSESFHNVANTADFWTANVSYFMGFSRANAASHIFAFGSGTYSGYSGKSAGDGDITGGTSNYAGNGNPGGLPVFSTMIQTVVYVMRSSVWTQCFSYVWRSGAYSLGVPYVWRSGAYQYSARLPWVVWMQRSGRHIPAGGMAVIVDVGEGPERGWVIEGEVGWFGDVDPSQYPGIDLLKPGHHRVALKPHNLRYNRNEPQQWVELRQFAKDRILRLAAQGDSPAEVEIWKTLTGPEATWQSAAIPASWMSKTTAELTRAVLTRASRASSLLPPNRARHSTIWRVGAASATFGPTRALSSSGPTASTSRLSVVRSAPRF